MPFFCEIDARNQTFELKTNMEADQERQTMADWLREIVELLRSIRENYDQAMKKDGRILGLVRNHLVEGMDRLFTGLLVLQRTMHENIPTGLNRSLELKPRVPVLFTLNSFSSQGVIRQKDLSSIDSFEQSFVQHIVPGVKNILERYRNMISPERENRVVDFQEIFKVFDEIFYQLLVLRHNVVDCVIDR